MTHVFAISSHLTFSIMRKTCEINNISANDCVLLLLRNYQIPTGYENVYIRQIPTSYNVDTNSGRVFSGLNFIKTKHNIDAFYNLVDSQLQGSDYYFYTQVCSNDISSLMVTPANCKGYYLIEDGLSSYRNYNPQTFTGLRYILYKLVLKPLWPQIFAIKNHFIEDNHPKFKGCIASSQQAFPLHQHCLQVVGNPFERMDMDITPDAVISIDPLYDKIDDRQIDALYSKLSQYMAKKGYKAIAYKLHPRYNAQVNAVHKAFVLDCLKRYFPDIVEIAPSVVLESMLTTCKADFYSCDSTVALFAHQAGSDCYSLEPLLKGTKAYNPIPLIADFSIPVQILS